ncbi:hypothetical protein EV182_001511, partial [Spiromyces aspiralis]
MPIRDAPLPYELRLAICKYTNPYALKQLQQLGDDWRQPAAEVQWHEYKWLRSIDTMDVAQILCNRQFIRHLRIGESSKITMPIQFLEAYGLWDHLSLLWGRTAACEDHQEYSTTVSECRQYLELRFTKNTKMFCDFIGFLFPKLTCLTLHLDHYRPEIIDTVLRHMALHSVRIRCMSSATPAGRPHLGLEPFYSGYVEPNYLAFSKLSHLEISFFRVPAHLLVAISQHFKQLEYLKVCVESSLDLDDIDSDDRDDKTESMGAGGASVMFTTLKQLVIYSVNHINVDDRLGICSYHFPVLEKLVCTSTAPSVNQYRPNQLFERVFSKPWPLLKSLTLPFITDALVAKITNTSPYLYELEVEADHFYLSPPLMTVRSTNMLDLGNGVSTTDTTYSEEEAEYGQEFTGEKILTDTGYLNIMQSLPNLTSLVIGSNTENRPHLLTNTFLDSEELTNSWECGKNLRRLLVMNWCLSPRSLSILLSAMPSLEALCIYIHDESDLASLNGLGDK